MSILSKKYLPPLLGVATLAWIVGGTYWFQVHFCDTTSTTAPLVAAQNTTNHLPFYFPMGDSKPVFMPESFSFFKETADFLNDNRGKKLIVNGLFSSKEARTANSRLGLERAESIKKALVDIGTLPKSIETQSTQRNNLFFVNQQLFDGVEFKVEETVEGRFQALNLFFKSNKYQFADSDELKGYFNALHHYLSSHPNVRLKITAHHDNTEGGQVSRKRLAFMRQFLKNYDFLPQYFAFEDLKDTQPFSKTGKLKNRRIEIRLIIP
ncbi:MAG: hypothetical protein JNL70_14235 [Saprospiraceae bacterium]|nr:hypothetical protein [Saprospiraceae bacterium]